LPSFDFDALLERARGDTPGPAVPPKRRRPLTLVGVSEVAAMLGCSKQNVSQMARRSAAGVSRSGFPKPHTVTSAGPVFDRRKIEDWHAARDAA